VLPEPPATLAGFVHAVLFVVNATVPVKPLIGLTVMLEVPAAFTLTVTLVGLALSEKSGGAVTV
jgi:hypothetical protein